MAPVLKEIDLKKGIVQCLDEAVEEVFRLMMDVPCVHVSKCPDDSLKTISAVIGLAGSMSGTCVLRCGEKVALRMTERLSGASIFGSNDTVTDAFGEISNMIAGAWKGKQANLAAACLLSTPTVVTGTDYHLFTQRPEFKIERFYRFESFNFSVTLVCESVK